MIDWVAFFTQYPYLINSAYVFMIWMQWGIAFGFLFSYPMMHPFNYMMNRMDNWKYGKNEYWWSEKTFREVYPTYRSYVITYSLNMQIYYVTKWLPWKIRTTMWYIDDFLSKVIRYYLT